MTDREPDTREYLEARVRAMSEVLSRIVLEHEFCEYPMHDCSGCDGRHSGPCDGDCHGCQLEASARSLLTELSEAEK